VVKPPLRTKTLGTKVSEEEFAQLEAAASERGLTLSEWCRETRLASVNGQEEKSADAGGTGQALFARSIMAELVALRAILLNVADQRININRRWAKCDEHKWAKSGCQTQHQADSTLKCFEVNHGEFVEHQEEFFRLVATSADEHTPTKAGAAPMASF
jgi:hypothetical protein